MNKLIKKNSRENTNKLSFEESLNTVHPSYL